jgi:hypothetical protein
VEVLINEGWDPVMTLPNGKIVMKQTDSVMVSTMTLKK